MEMEAHGVWRVKAGNACRGSLSSRSEPTVKSLGTPGTTGETISSWKSAMLGEFTVRPGGCTSGCLPPALTVSSH